MKIVDETGVLRACKKIAKLNNKILEARRFDGTFSDFLVQESVHDALTSRRERLLARIADYDEIHNVDRRGEWLLTSGGHRFWPLDPRPQDIHIEDIAHGLSMLCRFCGQVKKFYSVGHHSVLVSRIVHPRAALAGLLHDASEAYLGDIIRPIKQHLDVYKKFEDATMRAVCQKFGLNWDDEELWNEVKRADNVLLATEFRDVTGLKYRVAMPEELPTTERIGRCWGTARGKREFLARFEELTRAPGALV